MPENSRTADTETRLRSLEQWRAEHGGREEERWKSQSDWNSETTDRINDMDTKFGSKLDNLKTIVLTMKGELAKYVIIAGFAGTALGALVGALARNLLG